MRGRGVRIGRLLGTEIRVDAAWLVVAALVTWSLATHYLPSAYAGWATLTYWLVGALASLLLFVSVLVHELSHAVAARALGTPVRDITLIFFSGTSNLADEPRRPRAELLTAIVGPLITLALAALFGTIWWVAPGRFDALRALSGWLALSSVVLGVFNFVPCLPLDGGRMLRAALWSRSHDRRRATVVTGTIGQAFSTVVLIGSLWQFFSGNPATGLWLLIIGWFLRMAATTSIRGALLEGFLAGHTAGEVMLTGGPQAPRHATLDVVMGQMMGANGGQGVPVVDQDRVVGLLTWQRLCAVPQVRRRGIHADEVMVPAEKLQPVRPDDDLVAVVGRMTADEGRTPVPVVDDGEFVGLVTPERLARFIRTYYPAARAGRM